MAVAEENRKAEEEVETKPGEDVAQGESAGNPGTGTDESDEEGEDDEESDDEDDSE